jgi:hypothetical protein
MQSDHQGWGPRLRRHLRAQHLRSTTQDGKCPLPGFTQFRNSRKRNAGLEHRGIIGRLGPRKFEIGLAQSIERGEWLRAAIVQRLLEHNRELFKSAQREVGKKFITITEMAIRRGRANAGPPRSFGEGEAAGPFFAINSKAARSSASFRLPW